MVVARRWCRRGSGPGLDAQLGVEVGEGLIQEEDGRLADDRTPEGHTLALATGELLWLAVQEVVKLDHLGRFFDPAVDFGLGVLRSLRPKAMLS